MPNRTQGCELYLLLKFEEQKRSDNITVDIGQPPKSSPIVHPKFPDEAPIRIKSRVILLYYKVMEEAAVERPLFVVTDCYCMLPIVTVCNCSEIMWNAIVMIVG